MSAAHNTVPAWETLQLQPAERLLWHTVNIIPQACRFVHLHGRCHNLVAAHVAANLSKPFALTAVPFRIPSDGPETVDVQRHTSPFCLSCFLHIIEQLYCACVARQVLQ